MFQGLSIVKSATFDPTGTYRYSLSRLWNGAGPALAVIMLNPSQADQTHDDPTLRRCLSLAQGWGHGQLEVVNLFAYRTPSPRQLRQVADPVGPDNDRFLLAACEQASQILLAWGNWGSFQCRDRQVMALLQAEQSKFCCLGLNRTSQPRHPLYTKRRSQALPWPPPTAPNAVSHQHSSRPC